MKKIIFLIFCFFIFLLLSACGRQTNVVSVNINSDVIAQSDDDALQTNGNNNNTNSNSDGLVKVEIPTQLDLGVPFVSQAPLQNWDMPYQEACEEASMISVAKFYDHSPTDSNTIDQNILALMDWEEKNGYKIDASASEVVGILQKYFKLNARLATEVTADRIKYELSQGNPIIVPTAGRMLGNPYFSGDGPIYHMLVIRGYDSKNFITNDVGTNTKGEKFKYKYQVIINAIHDWDHALAEDGMTEAEIMMGEKVMIVVEGNNY